MWCTADNHNNMCHIIYAKGFLDLNYNQAVIGKYQIFTKLPKISDIHKNRNFEVWLETDRPTASSFLILLQGHKRKLLFHFLPGVSR